MEATANILKIVKYRRWLPYVAVLQTDLRQTRQSWVYRLWVGAIFLAAFGYLLYRLGVHREAGIIQPASLVMSDLIRWIVMGSAAVIAALTVGSISSERGTLADSVLSRGISRYQYFLAKWHARLAGVVGTFLAMGALMLIASHFMLHENLSLSGSLVCLTMVAGLFGMVASAGVTLSATCNNSRVAMTILWLALYGGGALLELLPRQYETPDRILQQLPEVLRGNYDPALLGDVIGVCALVSGIVALVGLVSFARRDV
jgi:ABC-2 type transport system permease protein